MSVELPRDNELIRMAEEIDWDSMIEIVGKKYSGTDGRKSKSLRMMIGLEIAKRKYGMSDSDIVGQLKVDMALKVFCGFHCCDHETVEASSLTVFRRRLDQETLRQMEEANVRKIMLCSKEKGFAIYVNRNSLIFLKKRLHFKVRKCLFE